MVLSRECYVYFALFAGLLADELLLKVVDECMGTDRKRIVLSLAALESLSVYGIRRSRSLPDRHPQRLCPQL